MLNVKRTLIALVLLLPSYAHAFNSGLTYHGRILKPDSSPEIDSVVQFKIQIRTPGSENCLMYEEVQTKDLSASSGAFAITLNDGSGSRTDTSGYQLDQIFGNRTSMTFNFAVGVCSLSTSYSPNLTDGRKFVVQFKDSTMSSWEPMPTQTINFVPSAIESYQIGGFPSTSLFRVENASGPQTVSSLSPAQASVLMNLAQGTTQYVTTTSNGAALPSFASDPSTPVAGDVWYDSTNKVVKYYDGTSVQVVGSGGAVSGNSITSGTIGGTTSMNSSGTVTAASVSSTTNSTQNLQIFNTGNTHKVTVTVPAALAADYSMQLPGALPTASSQVLVSNTSGVTSWSPAMTIAASGNVGIGTATPANILSVFGPNTTGADLPVITASASVSGGGAAEINVLNTNATDHQAEVSLNGQWFLGNSSGANTIDDLYVYHSGTGQFPFKIDSSDNIILESGTTGNVGIGTTTPGALLEVGGTALVDGSLAIPRGPTSATPSATFFKVDPTTHAVSIDFDGYSGLFSLAGTIYQQGGTNIFGGPIVAGGPWELPKNSLELAVAPSQYAGTGSQSGTTVTGTGTNFTTGMIGSQLTWWGGNSAGTIVAVSSPTSLTVSNSLTVNPGSGFNISYTGLNVDTSGNVGVGTTTPAGNLAIDNAGHNATLCLNGTCSTTIGGGGGSQASTSNFTFNSNSDGTGSDGGFNFQSNGSNIFQVSNTGAITTYGNVTGNSALTVAAGGTNQNLTLSGSGTGSVVLNPNVGIGTTTPSSTLSFGGQSARTIGMERQLTANTPGNNLTISAGGATLGATTKAGGDLVLQSGTSTGQGSWSMVRLNASNYWAGSTTADQSMVTSAVAHPWGISIQPGVADYNTDWIIDAAALTVIDDNSYVTASQDQALFENRNSGAAGARIGVFHSYGQQGGLSANDEVGTYEFNGLDAGQNTVHFATIRSNVVSAGNGTSDGKLTFTTVKSGTSNDRMTIDQKGNVGIGTTSPRSALDVNGTILAKPEVSNATSTIDFSTGNIQYTANSCGSFQLNNLKDGGSYMFIVKGTSAATCTFTGYSDAGTTAITVHMPPDNGSTTAGKHTVFNIAVGGTDAYVAWTPGY